MNEVQFKLFREYANGIWISIEENRLALISSRDHDHLKLNRMKWLTIVAGVVTGVASLIAGLGERFPGLELATGSQIVAGLAGVLTSFTVGAGAAFKWDDEAVRKWNVSKKLSEYQTQIAEIVTDTGKDESAESAAVAMTRISNGSASAVSEFRIVIPGEIREKAQHYAKIRGVAGIPFTGSASDTGDPYVTEELPPQQIEGLTAIARGGGVGE